VNKEADIIE